MCLRFRELGWIGFIDLPDLNLTFTLCWNPLTTQLCLDKWSGHCFSGTGRALWPRQPSEYSAASTPPLWCSCVSLILISSQGSSSWFPPMIPSHHHPHRARFGIGGHLLSKCLQWSHWPDWKHQQYSWPANLLPKLRLRSQLDSGSCSKESWPTREAGFQLW